MIDKSSLVSVVIVNYSGRDYLGACLESIALQSYLAQEVIVVDNGSFDGSQEMVENIFPEAILIKNKENLYFCAVYNQGIKAANGEFILCLNNDVILDKDFMRNLIIKKDIDSKIGIWSGKILRMDKITIDSTGQFLGRNRKPVERGYGQFDNGKFNQEGYVFGACAAAVLFRKGMLEQMKINGEYFDQDFKMFYEDLDICWRANRFGWKAYYVPQALAYHKRGGTAKEKVRTPKFLDRFAFVSLPAELQVNFIKNRYLTIIKNDNLKYFIKDFIFIISYDILLYGYILIFRPRIIMELFKLCSVFKSAFKKREIISDKLAVIKQKYDLQG